VTTFAYQAIQRVAEQLGAIAETLTDPIELVTVRQGIQQGIAELRVLADELDQRAVAVWPEGPHATLAVDGVGVFGLGRKGNRDTWDHAAAARAVMDAALQAGDVLHPRDAGVVLLRTAAVTYWRIKETQAMYGLNVAEYRSREPGPLTIVRQD
jgi:hypothetical protein